MLLATSFYVFLEGELEHRCLCLPHTDYLRACGTWEHTAPRAFRPQAEESCERRCQHIWSLGKQAGWIAVWGPELKLTGSHPVQIMSGNAIDLLSFLSLSDQELFLGLFQQQSQWDGRRPRRTNTRTSQGFTGVIYTNIFCAFTHKQTNKNVMNSFHLGCDKMSIKEHLSPTYRSVSSILRWGGISFKKQNILHFCLLPSLATPT